MTDLHLQTRELLNQVAAKATDKWKKIGHQLKIQHHRLTGSAGLFGLTVTHARLYSSFKLQPACCMLVRLILQISQRDVDIFWKDSKPPCCQVKVIAQDTPKTSPHLHYPVPVKNIRPEKTIFIQCSLTETNKSCELCEILG